jgi:radical SAM protein with 4Fe4S-binding SPASM domain
MTDFQPRLVSWNITRRCNLSCAHCYLEADSRASSRGEMMTHEAVAFIEQLATLCPGAMLVFSGGEPLMRADLSSLVSHAARMGLLPVLGTNGVMLTDARAGELAENGLQGVGLSLDSLDARKHDEFRGVPGSWRKTVDAIESCRHHGLAVQIHTTATRENHMEIPELISFAAELGAAAFNLFFLVCTGRGQEMTDITPAQYEAALRLLASAQETYRGRMLVRARCAPHFVRLVHERGAEIAAATAGCMAGTEYMRVTPEADVTPCPYVPATAGNLRVDSLADIWETAPVFAQLRRPNLTGRCGACEYTQLCGGCRARALATSGDLMAEDPWCEYEPGQSDRVALDLESAAKSDPEWTEEAHARLARVPAALRPMVERGVVAYARSKGLGEITPELMKEMRARAGRVNRPWNPSGRPDR